MKEPSSGNREASRAAAVAVGVLVLAVGLLLAAGGGLGAWRTATSEAPDTFTVVLVVVLLLAGLALSFRGLRYMGVVPAGALASRPARRTFAGVASLAVPGVGQLFGGSPRRALAHWLAFILIGMAFLTAVFGASVTALATLFAVSVAIRLGSAVDAFRITGPAPVRRRCYERWYTAVAVIIALELLALVVVPRVQRVKSFVALSSSMEPTILAGDHVLADLRVGAGGPRVGQLVVVASPEKPDTVLLSRVVGIAGDVLEIRDKELLRNGQASEEPWKAHRDARSYSTNATGPAARRDNLEPQRIPAGHFYVMGDNRDFSFDSRFFGPVPIENLRGTVLFTYWSADRSRIGRSDGGSRR